MSDAAVAFSLTRESAFSYVCGRCKRCCFGKRIALNPYEVVRLAEVRGTTTTEIIERFTEDGVALAVTDAPGQPCVFLGEDGCTVHGGRPLACRFYPLGRLLAPSGEEFFAQVEPHPETKGVYGKAGTVGDYLAAQEVDRFLKEADAYFALFGRVSALLQRLPASPKSEFADEAEDMELWDVDAVATGLCAERGEPVPATAEGRTRLHREAVGAWLDSLEKQLETAA